MLHVLLSSCWRTSRLAKMVVQPWSSCHEHQHALHIMLTYTIDNNCALSRCIIFLGISTPECANDGITRRASHKIKSVVFYKILSRCAVFYLKNLCEGEDSTCHELRQYAQYPTRVWAIFMRLPFLLLRTPDLMQRRSDQNCIRIVLEQKHGWVKPHTERVALRVLSPSPFHEYTMCVTRNPPR